MRFVVSLFMSIVFGFAFLRVEFGDQLVHKYVCVLMKPANVLGRELADREILRKNAPGQQFGAGVDGLTYELLF